MSDVSELGCIVADIHSNQKTIRKYAYMSYRWLEYVLYFE